MAYVGELKLDNNIESYPIGSSLYGICRTAAGTTDKVVSSTAFTELVNGITVHIQFINGNTRETITLTVGSTPTLQVSGNCVCNPNTVLSFTYGDISSFQTGTMRWILNTGEKTPVNVMQHYDSTSSEPISGQGVAEAIAPLVPGGNSAANYNVDTEIGSTPGNNSVPTSAAVANYITNSFSNIDAVVYKGTLGLGGTTTNLPATGYSAGWLYNLVSRGIYAGQQCEIGDLILAVSDSIENNVLVIPSHWTIIQTNIINPVSGPNSATEGHIATFGNNNKTLTDSGYTIATSVPANAVFTDTHYRDKGSVQAIVGIEEGNEFNLAQVTQGRLHIASGFNFITASVSTGIQEVV